MTPTLQVIGNPGCRRVGFWKDAASRLGWAGVDVLTYADLLQNRPIRIDPSAVVRIESPGGDWQTFKLLLENGRIPAECENYPVLDAKAIECLEYERGWIIRPRQAHLGYLRLLQNLDAHLRNASAKVMQGIGEIALCFDKPACQARLAQRGVPIPLALGSPRSYEEMRPLARAHGRVMLKLAHGSGGAGCVALHYAGGRARGVTTVVEVATRGEVQLYHSKRPRYLTGEAEIAPLVDRLCVERVQLERWLPKAQWQGRNFDLRIVTIDGVPRHSMIRSSASIFTNLTLGNGRGDLAGVVRRMGRDAWQQLRHTAATVAAAFPGALTLGIDLLIRPDWQRHDVLEVNAFGDLLLNQLDEGDDTYTAALRAWQQRATSGVLEATAS